MVAPVSNKMVAKKRLSSNLEPVVLSKTPLTTLATADLATLRHRMQLNQPLFARLLPISVRSLATLEGGKAPTEGVTRRLNELLRLTDALAEVIQEEALGPWLKTPNSAFDGLKRLEVIERGESDRIWSMIFFLRSGVPS